MHRSSQLSLLLYTRTIQYPHASIPAGVMALKTLAAQNGYRLVESTDPETFRDATLSHFNAIIFFNTSGDVLDEVGKGALQRYVESGGGIVAIHGAAATMEGWPWYVELIGGTFASHPEVQQGLIRTVVRDHPATAHLSEEWEWVEEWYNFRQLAPDLNVLLQVDESSYTGGEHGLLHPIAWTRETGRARVFYTGIGHQPEAFADPRIVQHLLGGIRYAAGVA